ncbi:unnamed protein product [Rhizophagus irregularis]|nr:unnamed protein product [Rhizophagus irregularis]
MLLARFICSFLILSIYYTFLQERTERFFQNGDLEEGTVSFDGEFSGLPRIQEVREGTVSSFAISERRFQWISKNAGSCGRIEDTEQATIKKTDPGTVTRLEFVKEYWHSDLEFSCKGTCIRTWNSLAKRVG